MWAGSQRDSQTEITIDGDVPNRSARLMAFRQCPLLGP